MSKRIILLEKSLQKRYKQIYYLSIFLLIYILVLHATSTIIYAHPGRTDARGGHTCRTNCPKWGLDFGEYHSHGATTIPMPKPGPASEPVPIKENNVNTINQDANTESIKTEDSIQKQSEEIKKDSESTKNKPLPQKNDQQITPNKNDVDNNENAPSTTSIVVPLFIIIGGIAGFVAWKSNQNK